ncbi:MAG: DEAD/DEAH box helicase family protein [Flavobacteriia bacterium]|nr:DEAD/DEAH box helicase family protein [Flavobacteriia bacterium]
MELKPYQQTVINELGEFINTLDETQKINRAYDLFWERKGVLIHTLEGHNYLKPYNNSITGVPRVTMKVPTAGGKTFIACNALKTIFDSYPLDKPKVAVWFVPSDTILQQTLKNLNDTSHPYRQKIDSHFGSAVKVYDKETLIQGASFGPAEVKEQLSLLVLSVQSFVEQIRKGLPRAFRENSSLLQFPQTYQQQDKLLPNVDETALIQVINQLNPVVIIDESHNVESGLRVDMLNNINPSFILELTATPRVKSNIISFVDAIHLKKNNMVKLPVIVYNHQDTNEVISGAINLQKTLEDKALEELKNGGKYIRPIVLFQAQPRSNDDNITFDKIKEQLIEAGIPEEQVKIKTSGKDEISKEDLMSPDCKVRYIITVNALKEGWDCPFAYVLASLANKSSAVDVEQILGRILRQPYVTKHQQELLNFSYVLTSSTNFIATLDKIIEGLNKSGFSEKDYRTKEMLDVENATVNPQPSTGSFEDLFMQSTNEVVSNTNDTIPIVEEINPDTIKELSTSEKAQVQLNEIVTLATQTNEAFEKTIEQLDQEDIVPHELGNAMKTFEIKELFKEEAKSISLPAFYIKVNQGSFFNEEGSEQLLSKNLLLKDFALSQQETAIDFSQTGSEMYRVDLVESKKDEYIPEYKKENNMVKEAFVKYISGLTPEAKINQLTGRILKQISKVDSIPEPELKKYISSILSNLDADKLAELSSNEAIYANKIKAKINSLSDAFAEKQFSNLLDKGSVICKGHFSFPSKINPVNTVKGITKNLYEQEGEMNDFEKKVINDIANLDSVVFWHRNLERGKGFCLNGFVNHYPDFIVKTKNGKILLVETKGDDRDNSDSAKKIRLGEKWASKAGDNYRYFMVFNTAKLEGAKSIPELLDIIGSMK